MKCICGVRVVYFRKYYMKLHRGKKEHISLLPLLSFNASGELGPSATPPTIDPMNLERSKHASPLLVILTTSKTDISKLTQAV